jgi:transposase
MTPKENLSAILDIKGFNVVSVHEQGATIWLELKRPGGFTAVCSGCGQASSKIHDRRQVTVRDLALAGRRSYLRVEVARVRCEHCGVRQERLDFLARNPRYTARFVSQVARLCLIAPLGAVAAIAELAWHTVRGIFESVAKAELALDTPPSDLRKIGVDEKSWRHGRRFCTVVTDLQTGRVVWVGEGRSKAALENFFAWLGKRGCARIEACAIDLADFYEAAARKHCPNAKIVYDRYHVVKLLLEALNDVRKHVVREAQDGDRSLVTNKKWILLSHERNLRRSAKAELDELLELNRPLAEAHLLKEDFLRLYDFKDENAAGEFLRGWVARAFVSDLEPFKRFARQVADRLDGFLNHIRYPLPMGVVEAINSRLSGLIRRARGFRSVSGFIAMAMFLCGRPASFISDRSVFPCSL